MQKTFLLVLLIAFGCSRAGESQLSRALSAAVKERKVSQKKMDNILAEYDKIRKENSIGAREYAIQILTALEVGGDSTHIDAIRREMLRKRNEGKVGV